MNKTIIVCLIYSPNITDKKVYLVSNLPEDLSLPQIDLSTIDPKKNVITIDNILNLIFAQYINIDFSWTKPKLVNIELETNDDNDIITILYYSIYVPSNTKINNAYWLDIEPYVPHYGTLRKLLCML